MKKTKKKEIFDDEIKLLKKQGLWYKSSLLKKRSTVFIIACIATVIDGLTIYYTLNPILKGNFVMNFLLTITASAILDVFPSYWLDGIDKVKNKKDPTVKLMLMLSVVSWCFVFICISFVRIYGWQFVLQNTLQEQYLNRQNNVDMFIPVLDKTLGIMIMLFLCFVNFATSAAVLLVSAITYIPESVMNRRKRFCIDTLFKRISAEKQTERQQLDSVIGFDFVEYETQKHNKYEAEATAESQRQKKIAIEDLVKELGDPDVAAKLLNITEPEV